MSSLDAPARRPILLVLIATVLTNGDTLQEIVELRGALGKIDNSMLFPIPFQYYHIVNVVLTLHLVLMAYAFVHVSGSKVLLTINETINVL